MPQNIVYSINPVGIMTVGLYFTDREPEFTNYYTSSDINVGIITASQLNAGIATVGLGTTSSPTNSQMSFELTSNTNLRIKVRGTDGVLRSANITLA